MRYLDTVDGQIFEHVNHNWSRWLFHELSEVEKKKIFLDPVVLKRRRMWDILYDELGEGWLQYEDQEDLILQCYVYTGGQ